jgi:hypothetical protein
MRMIKTEINWSLFCGTRIPPQSDLECLWAPNRVIAGIHRTTSWLMIVALLSLIACHRGSASDQIKMSNARDIQQRGIHRREIIGIVRDFATSDSTKQKAAWAKLSSYPRVETARELQALESGETTSTAERIALAFALCNLEIDYAAHRLVIVNALAKEPHYENPLADWETGLIGRLIRRGDKTLLPIVFNAAGWSDGAMTEDLASIVEQELVNDPGRFLVQLIRVPSDTRENVYELIDGQTLRAEDIVKIKSYLRSVPSNSNDRQVAGELLNRLSELELLKA